MDENTIQLKLAVCNLNSQSLNHFKSKVMEYRAKTTTTLSLSQYFWSSLYVHEMCMYQNGSKSCHDYIKSFGPYSIVIQVVSEWFTKWLEVKMEVIWLSNIKSMFLFVWTKKLHKQKNRGPRGIALVCFCFHSTAESPRVHKYL